MPQRQWPSPADASPQSLHLWAQQIIRLLQRQQITGTVRHLTSGQISTPVATLDIDIPADADLLEIDLTPTPATDGANLYVRFSQSGAFLAGPSDYAYANLRGATHTSVAGAAQIVMGTGLETFASSFTVKLIRPTTTSRKYAHWSGLLLDSAASAPTTISGGGRMLANTNPIDGIQFLFSTGNIAAVAYGVRAYRYA